MKFVFVETGNYFCSDCDPFGLIMEASSYLQQVKKEINHVKLELSYARPTRAGGGELLASVVFKVSKNSNILKYSINHQPGKRS